MNSAGLVNGHNSVGSRFNDALKDSDMRTPDQKPIAIFRHGYLAWREAVQPPQNAVDIESILKSHEPWPTLHLRVSRSGRLKEISRGLYQEKRGCA